MSTFRVAVVAIVLIALVDFANAGANAPLNNVFSFKVGKNNVINEGENPLISIFQSLVYRRDGRWDNGLAKREELEAVEELDAEELEKRAYVYKCDSNVGITAVNGSIVFKKNGALQTYNTMISAAALLLETTGTCYKYNSTINTQISLPNYFVNGPAVDSIYVGLTWGTFASKKWYYQQKQWFNITVLNVAPSISCDSFVVTRSEVNKFNVKVLFSDPAGSEDAPYNTTINWDDGSFSSINENDRTTIDSINSQYNVDLVHSYSVNQERTISITIVDKDGGVSNTCSYKIEAEVVTTGEEFAFPDPVVNENPQGENPFEI